MSYNDTVSVVLLIQVSLVNISEVNLKELMTHLKNKEFTKVRKWVVDNIDNDPVKGF